MAGSVAEIPTDTTPFLGFPRSASQTGKASTFKTFFTIIISFLGAGVLGLPYTFRVSGWATAAGCVTAAAILCFYCMMHLVKCREWLQEHGHDNISSYGDVGHAVFGNWGRELIDVFVLISQCGCCVSYLIFIGGNVSSIFNGDVSTFGFYIAVLTPFQVLLAWVQSLSGLGDFNVFANICNILAMAVVAKDDLHEFSGFSEIRALGSWSAMPFAMGVAIYCYEGFGVTLTIHSSMEKPRKFGKTLGSALVFVTCLYLSFGFMGYLAYGDKTKDIITLNLPKNWTTIVVKFGLCIGLFFTIPNAMFPVHEIFEKKLLLNGWFQKYARNNLLGTFLLKLVRALIILGIVLVAVLIPVFSVLMSFVGSTTCAMIAFVVPAALHMQLFWDESSWPTRVGDITLVIGGLLFAIHGTYSSALEIFNTV